MSDKLLDDAWQTSCLKEVVVSNGIQTGPFGSQIHASDYTEVGVPVVMPKDMVNYRISDQSISRIPEQLAKRLERHKLQTGDLVFSRRGEIGRCALVLSEQDGWLCGTGSLRVRLSPEKAIPEYLIHSLTLPQSVDWLVTNAVGQTMLNLSATVLSQLPLTLPPLPEQRKIAQILGTWDAAIGRVEQLIAALQRRKQGLMQRLLTGQVRFGGGGNRASDGKSLPVDWERAQLQDRFQRITTPAPDSLEYVLSITATVGFVDQKVKFGRIIAGKSLERYVHLRRGDFAYNKGNSEAYPQGCICLLEEFDEGAVPNVYFSFRARSDQVVCDFYKYYFESGALNHQLSRRINSGVRNDGLLNLMAEDFFNTEILVPPKAEQVKIAQVMGAAAREIALAKQQLAALRQQKKGLMQRLLTGQVRVNTTTD